MTAQRYQIRQCEEKECHFRFPTVDGITSGHRCPKCGGKTRPINVPYGAKEVEIGKFVPGGAEVEALLDNIRSVFNVGNMLRTADGAGIRHMHLCGITPTPNNPKLAKTALGAERSVPWTQHGDGLAAAVSLKKQGLRLWALEGGPRAELLFDARVEQKSPPIVLVVGSEISGVDPGILEHCERVLCLPMQGSKNTLNVAVAFGIAAYFLRFALTQDKGKRGAASMVI
jgi:23S rRNA (guanosine2251-2'-O)-methyltransferase